MEEMDKHVLEKYMKGLESLTLLDKKFHIKRCLKKYQDKKLVTISNNCDLPFQVIESYIADFENRTGGLIYYVMADEFWFGKVISILFISEHKEEYELSKVNENGEIFAATYNLNMNGYLEYGYITLGSYGGELYRKA